MWLFSFLLSLNFYLEYCMINTKRKATHPSIIFYRLKLGILIGCSCKFINYSDIIRIYTNNEYRVIELINGKIYFIIEPLKYMELHLPPIFMRVHRSYIINLSHIKEYHIHNRTVTITLSNNIKCDIARSVRQNFITYIKKTNDLSFPSIECIHCNKNKCLNPFINTIDTINENSY